MWWDVEAVEIAITCRNAHASAACGGMRRLWRLRSPQHSTIGSRLADDFTRVPSAWARRLPEAKMLPQNCSLLGPFQGGGSGCERWWKRKKVREYLPPLDRTLLEEQVIRRQGWPVGGARTPADPCAGAGAGDAVVPHAVCMAVVELRRIGAPLRRFVGIPLGRTNGAAFIDGPCAIISGALVAVLALRFALRRVRA